MSKKLLIDAIHPEETRVALVDEKKRLVEYDIDTKHKQTVKGNVYLAKVMRVEPSLQAAFVDYGGNRHGFLAFSEIHPDYFRIPVSDREVLDAKLKESIIDPEAEQDVIGSDSSTNETDPDTNSDDDTDSDTDAPRISTIAGESVDHSDDDQEDARRRRPALHKMYKIQEVIHKNQILLIQVVKEERGQKGAALTTYMSLAGRYCVLMPNSPQAGGISRKIANPKERKKMREVLSSLELPQEMGMIIRTAGRGHTKTEIKRDATYLMRQWSEIRETTLQSMAPSLIYQEDSIIKRVIRDQYDKDTTEILVSGDETYKSAKTFMKKLLPSHAKNVKQYKNDVVPLFIEHKIEHQVEKMHDSTVMLPSGGSIVINPTEALVSIDINSGRATKERHIEDTALNTNLEAAVEIARQVRLRDLAGLVVIDFIDMDDRRHTGQVERKVREAFKNDRARVQMGKISPFGLLELSRQRLRPSMLETSSTPCPHCHATGYIRSTESMSLLILRVLEEEGITGRSAKIKAVVPSDVAFYILNEKRMHLAEIEARHSFQIQIFGDATLIAPHYKLLQLERKQKEGSNDNDPTPQEVDLTNDSKDTRPKRQPRSSHQKATGQQKTSPHKQAPKKDVDEAQNEADQKRRANNRRRSQRPAQKKPDAPQKEGANDTQATDKAAATAGSQTDESKPSEGKHDNSRRRGHRRRGPRGPRPNQGSNQGQSSANDGGTKDSGSDSKGPTPKPAQKTQNAVKDKPVPKGPAQKSEKKATETKSSAKPAEKTADASEKDTQKKPAAKRRSWLKKLLD